MDNNALIIGLIFGLVLAPGFMAIELKFFSFLVKFFKLNVKLNKPAEVLSLITAIFISVLLSLKGFRVPSYSSLMLIVFIPIIISGLWNLKKWVIYVFLIYSFLPYGNSGLFGIIDLRLIIGGLLSQFLVLLVYYLYVYKPNKELFT